jgi:hypothetical protein
MDAVAEQANTITLADSITDYISNADNRPIQPLNGRTGNNDREKDKEDKFVWRYLIMRLRIPNSIHRIGDN